MADQHEAPAPVVDYQNYTGTVMAKPCDMNGEPGYKVQFPHSTFTVWVMKDAFEAVFTVDGGDPGEPGPLGDEYVTESAATE